MANDATLTNPDAFNNSDALQSALGAAAEVAKKKIVSHIQDNPPGWVPLKPRTIAQRRRLGFNAAPMLYRSGALEAAAAQSVEVNGNSVTISTQDPNAILQANGGGNNIPGRDFYELTDDDLKEVDEAFSEAFVKQWGK